MADAPSPPWTYPCEQCTFSIVVNARGARGNDPGSGVEAANIMRDHVEKWHPPGRNTMPEDEVPDENETLEHLVEGILAITRTPMQEVARKVIDLSIECDRHEEWWRRKRERAATAGTPEDLFVAAINEAQWGGAKRMAEAIGTTLQTALA